MSQLIVAESAGFCFGVSRSIQMAEKILQEQGTCYCIGELIHNQDVVHQLEQSGLCTVDSARGIPQGATVLLRAHGVAESAYDELQNHGCRVMDATCPRVLKIHRIAHEASLRGERVIVIGMRNHPEVEGICGWCDCCLVFEKPEEIEPWFIQNPVPADFPTTVVVQTTQTRETFEKSCKILKKLCTNLKISDTICDATSMRQNEAMKISGSCDAMVVIGGRHSANSIHLAELCSKSCPNVQFIENAAQLDGALLHGAHRIGLTAGASTPAWIIKEVRNKMSDEIKNEATIETEPTFDQMLEESLKTIYNGDKVTGIVVAITGTEVSVDLGTKYSGFIPTTEFTDDGTKVEDAVKVGDEIEAIVVRVNDVEGTAQLSKKRLDAVKSKAAVEAAVEDGTVMEGVVIEENKGGVVVNVKGVHVFVPASQTNVPKGEGLSQLLKQTVRLRITEVASRPKQRVVGSIRLVTQAERRERIETLWNEMEIGKKYHGTVKSLTSYGAFVDIGGVDGMVHVSELSWGRIHQPSEVVAVGDEIDVYVINFDREKRKISLGYKDPNANPWSVFMNTYAVDSVAEVKVVKLMDFGAFAEVVPGVDGLIHISQLANRRVNKPDEVVKVGDQVQVKITAIDEEKHKVSLSIRALLEPAPAAKVKENEDDAPEALVYEVNESGQASGNIPMEPAE